MGDASEVRYIPDCHVKLDGQKLPVDKDAALTKVEIDLNADLFGQCRLTFNDPKMLLINGKDFSAGARIEVEMGFAAKLEKVFDGEVVALEPLFRRDSPPSLQVICLESLHRLALSQMTRSFNDVDPKEIATQIAQEHGLTADAPSGTKEHILQANVSDATFLRRLAQKLGQGLRIEGKKVIISAPAKAGEVELKPGAGLRKMKVTVNSKSQVETVTVHGWDPKTKKEFVSQAKGEGEVGEGARKHGGGKTLSLAGLESMPTDQATAEAMAKGRMAKLAEGFVTAKATVTGNPQLRPGNTISCSKFGDQINGTYRIDVARHHFSKHGYFVDLEAVRVSKTSGEQAKQQKAADAETKQSKAEADDIGKVEQPKQKDPAAAKQALVAKDAAKKGMPLVEECPTSKGTMAKAAS